MTKAVFSSMAVSVLYSVSAAVVPHDTTNMWNVADGNASVAANYAENALPGANAQVRIANGGTMRIDADFSWGALWAGYGSFGTVYQTAGTLTLSNPGSVTGDGTLWLGHSAGNLGRYFLSGGTIDVTSGNPQVGAYGLGLLDVSGGAFATKGYPSIGRNSGASGHVNVHGTGQLNLGFANQVSVGESGTGTLTVSNGGSVDAAKLVIGANASGVGLVNVASGGFVKATTVTGGTGTGRVNGIGGKMSPKASGGVVNGYLSGTSVTLGTGGLDFDTDGKSVTLASPLQGGSRLKAANLVHRWSFNGDYSDSVGGQDAVAFGSAAAGISFAGNRELVLPGAAHDTAYVKLGAGILPTDSDAFTVEIWTTPLSVRSWSRIFTCNGSNRASEAFMTFVGGSGTDVTKDFSCAKGGGSGGNASDQLAPWTHGQEFVAVLRATKRSDGWYVEVLKRSADTGALMKRYAWLLPLTWNAADLASDRFNLGWSTDGGNDDANAKFNEVRVWKVALTDDELTESATRGPDADFTGTADFTKSGAGALTLAAGNTYEGSTTVSEGTLAAGAFVLPVHRWSFNGDYSDSIGGKTASTAGADKDSIILRDGCVVLPGADHTKAYLSLGNSPWPQASDGFTLEFWIRHDAIRTWSRIFTTANDSYDSSVSAKRPVLFMTLVGGNGTNVNGDIIGIHGGESSVQPSGYMAPWTVGTFFHVSVTGHRNGETGWNLTFAKRDAESGAVLKTHTVAAPTGWSPALFANAWFNVGYSTDGGNDDAAMTVDEIRFWDRALSDADLNASVTFGPDALPHMAVSEGTGTLPSTTALTVDDGATFALAGAAQTVASLGGAGTVEGPGTLTVTGTIQPAGTVAVVSDAKLVGSWTVGGENAGSIAFGKGGTYDVSGLKLKVSEPEHIEIGRPLSIADAAGATLTGAFDTSDPSMTGLKLKVKSDGGIVVSRASGMVLLFR